MKTPWAVGTFIYYKEYFISIVLVRVIELETSEWKIPLTPNSTVLQVLLLSLSWLIDLIIFKLQWIGKCLFSPVHLLFLAGSR